MRKIMACDETSPDSQDSNFSVTFGERRPPRTGRSASPRKRNPWYRTGEWLLWQAEVFSSYNLCFPSQCSNQRPGQEVRARHGGRGPEERRRLRLLQAWERSRGCRGSRPPPAAAAGAGPGRVREGGGQGEAGRRRRRSLFFYKCKCLFSAL